MNKVYNCCAPLSDIQSKKVELNESGSAALLLSSYVIVGNAVDQARLMGCWQQPEWEPRIILPSGKPICTLLVREDLSPLAPDGYFELRFIHLNVLSLTFLMIYGLLGFKFLNPYVLYTIFCVRRWSLRIFPSIFTTISGCTTPRNMLAVVSQTQISLKCPHSVPRVKCNAQFEDKINVKRYEELIYKIFY